MTVNRTPRPHSWGETILDWVKCQVALPEPKEAWSLLVPKAKAGGMPRFKRTGSVIRPPPPAMESTKPAMRPVTKRTETAQTAVREKGAPEFMLPRKQSVRARWVKRYC